MLLATARCAVQSFARRSVPFRVLAGPCQFVPVIVDWHSISLVSLYIWVALFHLFHLQLAPYYILLLCLFISFLFNCLCFNSILFAFHLVYIIFTILLFAKFSFIDRILLRAQCPRLCSSLLNLFHSGFTACVQSLSFVSSNLAVLNLFPKGSVVPICFYAFFLSSIWATLFVSPCSALRFGCNAHAQPSLILLYSYCPFSGYVALASASACISFPCAHSLSPFVRPFHSLSHMSSILSFCLPHFTFLPNCTVDIRLWPLFRFPSFLPFVVCCLRKAAVFLYVTHYFREWPCEFPVSKHFRLVMDHDSSGSTPALLSSWLSHLLFSSFLCHHECSIACSICHRPS